MAEPGRVPLLVQRFLGRRHFYSAAAVSAKFVAQTRYETEYLASKDGTAFIVRKQTAHYFVTNRHVVDYNYGQPKGDVKPSAALDSVTIRGHSQPHDHSRPTFPWSYTHAGTTGITFHPDNSTDLAAISFPTGFLQSPFTIGILTGHPPSIYDLDWLATGSEIDRLTPGEQVFIVGYPGLVGARNRPVLVSGIISSDPRYPAAFGNAELGNAVLCHSFSWPGMSGAPVLGISEALGKTKIIGINAGHVGGSGITGGAISHFVRSSALIELLDQLD
jgi:Trypsin-like peptidase domain